MKTYFMAWQSDNKRGHSIHEFPEDTSPLEAFREILKSVQEEFSESGTPIQGVLSADQFNLVG